MTKSEKNVLNEVITVLNVLLNGNSDGDQTTQPTSQEEAAPTNDTPPQKEIEFIKSLKADGEIAIVGLAIDIKNDKVADIRISSSCLGRMLDAYLEKYDHE